MRPFLQRSDDTQRPLRFRTNRPIAMSDSTPSRSSHQTSRRQFFQQVGGAAGLAALTVTGCDSNDGGMSGPQTVTLDFSDDFGVLNYAYALEQLEAAFYATAAANFYGDSGSMEEQYVQDLAAHEGIHRDFLAEAIPALGGELIPNLEVDFSGVDFDDRGEVLATAKLLEDTGVSAYNGAGVYLENPDLVAVAGKIVSVEARHAASVRSLVNPGSTDFAGDDVVDSQSGLDLATAPSDVLSAVADTGLVETQLEATNVG